MRHYIGLVHKDPTSDFGVSFPDFPGCVTAGVTLEQAAALAAEALSGHIDLMAEESIPIPEPTGLDAIMQTPHNRSGIPILVPAVIRRAAKAVRVNVTLPEDVLLRIDVFAEAHGFTRSGFLAQAAKRVMDSDEA
jgi:predicted RNase H-like HicB family nuclease